MRRLIVTLAVVPVLLFAVAGQALAVLPPGVDKILATANDTCDTTGCTRTIVNGYKYVDGTAEVIASQARFDLSFVALWQYYGRTPVNPNVFTYDSRGFLVGIPTTTVNQVENLLPGNPTLPPRTVTVSASTHKSGKVTTNTYRSTDTDGTCTYNITQKNQEAAVVGTLTQDSLAMDANQQYRTFITEWTVKQQCPH